MCLSAFFQSLAATFLIIASVGPVFLTTANISMTQGYRSGIYAILGCAIGDIIFIITASLAVKAVVSVMPNSVIISLMFLASGLLLKMSHDFWKKDINNIRAVDVNKKAIALSIKMLFLTLSSPLSIVGYSVIFAAIVATNNAILSTMFGGFLGVCLAHLCIVLSFGFLGKKVNIKALLILNKISACLISFYAVLLIIKAVKMIASMM